MIRHPPPQSLVELRLRAEALWGHSVAELARGVGVTLPAESRRAKGLVGQLVELGLGADPRAGDGPDFPSLGVELKTVPVGNDGRPVESTFCCSVTMLYADRETWESSRLRRRLRQVLWVPVQAARLAPLAERCFAKACLWIPSAAELELLRADWEDLVGAIGAGRAPSAHEGQVLQVRPKAATGRVRTLAPALGGIDRVLPLGIYLRRTATATILNQGVLCHGESAHARVPASRNPI